MRKDLTPREAADLILKGKLVAFPTETVYGLGAHALNENAVKNIYLAKGRPANNPLICHFSDTKTLFQYGKKSNTAEKLSRYWPGPLSIILPHEGKIPLSVTAGSELCAFRIPDHPAALEMLRAVNSPVAAPSANLSGKRSPVTAEMVEEDLGDRIDGILDGGRCIVGIESTVLLLENERIQILRKGSITEEFLISEGFDVSLSSEFKSSPEKLLSPGLDRIHYRPSIPLYFLLEEKELEIDSINLKKSAAPFKNPGFLAFGKTDAPNFIPGENILYLSESENLDEAAHNLYFIFETMKRKSWDAAFIRPLPEKETGRAVNDRLKRACTSVAVVKNREIIGYLEN